MMRCCSFLVVYRSHSWVVLLVLPSFRTKCHHESWSSERKAFRSVSTWESLSPIEVHGAFGNADLPSTSWENPRAIAVFDKVWESLGQPWSFVSFCVHACVLACAHVKRQITGVNSLLQLHGFWVLRSSGFAEHTLTWWAISPVLDC